MKQTLRTFFKRSAIALATIALLSTNTSLFAQKAIQLTNIKTGKKLKPITTGTRVTYYLKPVNGKSQPKAINGILSEITAETLTVNGVTFPIKSCTVLAPGKTEAALAVFC